jgi:hypothetical protein
VDGHPQGRQRRPELVGDGGHEIGLELVEVAEARHVLQGDGRPGDAPPAS